jgi:single-stranded-DNA-specific exonuclease
VTAAQEWRAAPPPAGAAVLAPLGPRLAALLARRGCATRTDAESFLHPALGHLHDPMKLAGMAAALDRLERARARGEAVAVVGDYDADGVTAVALLLAVFRACGLEATPILPHRLREGYGFQPAHVDEAASRGAGLIVTVDCGTGSLQAARTAAERGIDVVVTDHHLPGNELPAGVVLINPHQSDCLYPFPDLAGVGLAFKLAQAFLAQRGREVPPEQLLRIACLGTIADLVPLRGENRVIASLGLRSLSRTRSAGLRALFERAGLRPPFGAEDVGFRLGPRLNAAGRLGSAESALELLLTRDPERAATLAAELESTNEARRREEATVVEEARGLLTVQADSEAESGPRLLAAWSEAWHPGVVGIAAGRLAREFHCPVLLLAVRGERATGSGRSVPGADLHGFLERWTGEYERFGGHAQAVGLTVDASRLPALRLEWAAGARDAWPAEVFVRRLDYELELTPAQVDETLWRELRSLEPYGMGNPAPLLRVGPIVAQRARVFAGKHLELHGAAGLVAVLWNGAARREELCAGPFEVLATLEHDAWRDAPVLRVAAARAVH